MSSLVKNEVDLGFPHARHFTDLHPDSRPATFDNEDLGFTAQIAAKDAYEFAMPNPSDIDLDNEVMILDFFEILIARNALPDLNGNLTVEALNLFLSMFNVDFDTTNPANVLDDVNSLEYKKCFMGPMHIRTENALLEHDFVTGTPAGSNWIIQSEDIPWGGRIYRVIPPEPLRLFLPLYLQLVNNSLTFTTVDLLTVAVEAAFAAASTEFFAIRPWYRKGALSSAERGVVKAFKYMRITA